MEGLDIRRKNRTACALPLYLPQHGRMAHPWTSTLAPCHQARRSRSDSGKTYAHRAISRLGQCSMRWREGFAPARRPQQRSLENRRKREYEAKNMVSQKPSLGVRKLEFIPRVRGPRAPKTANGHTSRQRFPHHRHCAARGNHRRAKCPLCPRGVSRLRRTR